MKYAGHSWKRATHVLHKCMTVDYETWYTIEIHAYTAGTLIRPVVVRVR